jgi:hypothetical protein
MLNFIAKHKDKIVPALKIAAKLLKYTGKYPKARALILIVTTIVTGGTVSISIVEIEACVQDKNKECITFIDGEWTEQLTFTEKADSLLIQIPKEFINEIF